MAARAYSKSSWQVSMMTAVLGYCRRSSCSSSIPFILGMVISANTTSAGFAFISCSTFAPEVTAAVISFSPPASRTHCTIYCLTNGSSSTTMIFICLASLFPLWDRTVVIHRNRYCGVFAELTANRHIRPTAVDDLQSLAHIAQTDAMM